MEAKLVRQIKQLFGFVELTDLKVKHDYLIHL